MIQVFSKNWFELHQAKLLRFANSKIGRYILRIHGKRSDVGENKIIKILPHAITWVSGEKNGETIYCTEFRTSPKFANRLYYAFKPIWWTMHFLDWLMLDRFEFAGKYSFGFDSLTAYPDAGTGSTTVDGYVQRGTVDETFGTIRGGAGNGSGATDTGFNAPSLSASSTTDQFSRLRRAIFTLDTSALTASASISAAVFSIKSATKNNGLGSPDIDLVNSSPASDNTLANGDYSNVGTTVYASIAYASYTGDSATYNDFTLSDTSGVSKTGITRFATRLSWDTDNSFTGTWSATAETKMPAIFADTAGTSEDPKLVITYTLVTGSGGTGTMMGI